ncbi:MAG: pilus assembly protein TadG-related protein [Pseudomonadota bacterium]
MRIYSDRSGNVAITAAILLSLLILVAGSAIDYQRYNKSKTELSELSDALALRGAREFLLANTSAIQIRAALKAALDGGLARQYGLDQVDIDVLADETNAVVQVRLSIPFPDGLISGKMAKPGENLIAESTAATYGGLKVCVVAVNENDGGVIKADFNAQLQANDCTIISNSASTSGIDIGGSSKLTAGKICTAGGYEGGAENFAPEPTTDCPVLDDPLTERQPPSFGSCDEIDMSLGEQTTATTIAAAKNSFAQFLRQSRKAYGNSTDDDDDDEIEELDRTVYSIEPGVYCGGLHVASNAEVRLNPGVYVIKDGALRVEFGGKLTGENVAFYLVGDDSTFYFGADSVISLTAPKTGDLAGILFFEDRTAPLGRTHNILSDDARVLLGTIYLPRGNLFVASLFPIADQSAYTVIVANGLRLTGNPTLVLNSDYSATDIPVPAGVGPVSGGVRLTNERLKPNETSS